MADRLQVQVHVDMGKFQSDLKTLQKKASSTKISAGAGVNKGLKETDTALSGILKKVIHMPIAFGSWLIIGNIISKLFSTVTDGIDTLFEFDKALTNISFTMDITNQELEDMMENALDTADAMSTTASEVLIANQIFTNLSESIESVNQKTETTIALANITGNSVTKTADAVQGLAFQFSIASEDVGSLADTMSSIARETGVEFSRSIIGMTEAVSRAGSVASDAGFSYNEFLATIATVQEQSRLTGGSIASGLTTILSRASRVSDASAKDISKVETALKKVSVQLRDETTGEFRDMFDVLVDLSKVYPDLTSIQQSELGFLLAGTRQRKVFNNIMANMDTIVQRSTDSLENQGLTMELNDKFAESLAGHTTDFKNSLEALFVSVGDSDTFKLLIDSGTDFIDMLTSFDEEVGLANATMKSVIPGMTSFLDLLNNISGSTNEVTEETTKLTETNKASTSAWNEVMGMLEGYNVILDGTIDSEKEVESNVISATEAYNDYKWSIAPVNETKKESIDVNKTLTDSELELSEAMKLPIDQLEINAELYPVATESMVNSEIDLTENVIRETEARIIARELELRSIQTLANSQLEAIRLSGAPESFIRQQEDSVAGLSGNLAMDLKQLGELRDRLSGLTSVQEKYFSTAKKTKKENVDLMKSYEDLLNQLEDTVFVTELFGEAISRTEGEKQIPILKAQNEQYKLQKKIVSSLIETIQEDINVKDLNAEQTRELEEEVQSLQLELSSLDTAFNSNLNTIKDINKAIEDDLLEQMEKLKEELEDTADIIADKLNEALEDEIDLIEEQKKAVEERFDAEIQLVQDSIDRLEKRNDALEDEKRLQEALLDVENARLKLSNIKAEKDVLLFTGGGATGFELVADPREVFQAEQDLAQSEKSLEELRVQQKQDAEIDKLEAKVKELEAEKEAELAFYDTQIENLQNQQELIQENIKAGNEIQQELVDEIIDIVETSELDSYDTRLGNLQNFVNDYNSKVSQLKSLPTGGGGKSNVVVGIDAIEKAQAGLSDTIPSRANGMEDGLVPGGLTLLHPKEGVVNQPQMNNVVKTFQDLALGNMPQIIPQNTQTSNGITINELIIPLPGVKDPDGFRRDFPITVNNIISQFRNRS